MRISLSPAEIQEAMQKLPRWMSINPAAPQVTDLKRNTASETQNYLSSLCGKPSDRPVGYYHVSDISRRCLRQLFACRIGFEQKEGSRLQMLLKAKHGNALHGMIEEIYKGTYGDKFSADVDATVSRICSIRGTADGVLDFGTHRRVMEFKSTYSKSDAHREQANMYCMAEEIKASEYGIVYFTKKSSEYIEDVYAFDPDMFNQSLITAIKVELAVKKRMPPPPLPKGNNFQCFDCNYKVICNDLEVLCQVK